MTKSNETKGFFSLVLWHHKDFQKYYEKLVWSHLPTLSYSYFSLCKYINYD